MKCMGLVMFMLCCPYCAGGGGGGGSGSDSG
jgi:hypothetical protein